MTWTDLRASFVDRFGEAEAARIEDAASMHVDDWRISSEDSQVGDDEFVDAFSVAIAYECVGRYAGYHGIEASESDLLEWSRESRALDRAIGPVDVLSVLSGAYEPWLPDDLRERSEVDS